MIRSMLFAPANRRDLLLKFTRIPADCFVIDLEDGTPPHAKVAARHALAEVVGELRRQALPGLLYVRVNEIASSLHADDLKAVLACDVDGVVLPKVEHAAEVTGLAAAIACREGRPMQIIGGIESMMGILNVAECVAASDRMIGIYFGAEDLAADMEIDRTLAGDEVAYARARAVMAARAWRRFAVDQAVPQLKDLDQFRRDAEKGRALGYTGKICVTPQQVELSNAIFSPGEDEVAEATRLVAAYQAGVDAGNEMIIFEGKMIVPEGPHIKRARRILASAEAIRQKAS